ncbi:MAG: hypothetical protein KJ579_08080 [Verrucomicrobia bacterium]|nr:hypothetical protein [Verrucomicrobiota bacterium]
MNPAPQDELDGLIERHFDGILDDEGRARLEAALQASPDAALRFARAARMDHRLHRHFHRRQALESILARIDAIERPKVVRLQPVWLRQIREHAWGPVGAIALHAALLLFLVRWVIVTPPPQSGEGVEITLAEHPDRSPLDRRPVLPDAPGADALRVPRPAVDRPPPIDVEPPGAADLRVAFLPLDTGTAASVDPARLAHPLVAGRFGAERRRRNDLYGGAWSAAADRAASNAVAWLAAAQSKDGAWRETGADDDALTSLVLLALMGRGETPVHGAHRDAVRSALQRLAASPPLSASPRASALRLCALADAVALTRLPALQTLLGDAAGRALDAERAGGGWNGAGDGADPLVTAWTVEALRVASTAGVDDPRLIPALRRAANALEEASNPTSGMLYYPAAQRREPAGLADTAASLLALQMSGNAPETRIQSGLRALDAMPAAWPGPGAPAASLEALYFATRVRFNEGGGGWMKWMAALAPSTVASTVSAGDSRHDGAAHTIRATALAVLILETPCRYPQANRWTVAHASIPVHVLFAHLCRRVESSWDSGMPGRSLEARL